MVVTIAEEGVTSRRVAMARRGARGLSTMTMMMEARVVVEEVERRRPRRRTSASSSASTIRTMTRRRTIVVMIGAAGADLKGVARFFFVPGGKERRARDGTQRANVLRGADATDYGRAHACPVRLSCRASTAQREERANKWRVAFTSNHKTQTTDSNCLQPRS